MLRKEWYFRVCTITSPKFTKYVSSYQDCFGLCNLNSTCQSAIYVESSNECYTSSDTTEVETLRRKYQIKEIVDGIYFTVIFIHLINCNIIFWVCVTNSYFSIPSTLKPDVVDVSNYKFVGWNCLRLKYQMIRMQKYRD